MTTEVKIGKSHGARKQLFQRGLRRGFLTIQEIESMLPPGTLTAAERWLLYYSLRAAEIEMRDESGSLTTVPPLTSEEQELLAAERRAAGEAPPGPPGAERGEREQAEEGLPAGESSPPEQP
jgi:hypothetical protein